MVLNDLDHKGTDYKVHLYKKGVPSEGSSYESQALIASTLQCTRQLPTFGVLPTALYFVALDSDPETSA